MAAGSDAERLAVLREAQSICERNEVSEVGPSVGRLQRCVLADPAAACGASALHQWGAHTTARCLPPLQ